MATIYAIEAWVLAVAGWGWLALREALLGRSLVEETALYGGLALATLNLAWGALAPEARPAAQRGFLSASIALSLLLAYALVEASTGANTGDEYLRAFNASARCCPNARGAEAPRRLLFGGSVLYLVCGAVTFALQTLQTLLAAAAVLQDQPSAWPGHSWSYAAAALLAAVTWARFAGAPLAPPCPSGAFGMSLGLGATQYAGVFAGFGCGALLLVVLEAADAPPAARVAQRSLGLVLLSLFFSSVGFACHGRGMLTPALLLLMGKCWLGAAAAIFAPCAAECAPALADRLQTACLKAPKRRTRFVLPLSAARVHESKKAL